MTKTAVERAEAQVWAEKVQELENALATCYKFRGYDRVEIDRLQIALQARGPLKEENEQLISEVERLEGERASDHLRMFNYEAEIERLRTAPWVFRCSCQIADLIAPECSSRGWCKERKPLLAEIEQLKGVIDTLRELRRLDATEIAQLKDDLRIDMEYREIAAKESP